jgi:hypothetical protein
LRQQFLEFVEVYGEHTKFMMTHIAEQNRVVGDLISDFTVVVTAMTDVEPKFKEAFNRAVKPKAQTDSDPVKKQIQKLEAELETFLKKNKNEIH